MARARIAAGVAVYAPEERLTNSPLLVTNLHKPHAKIAVRLPAHKGYVIIPTPETWTQLAFEQYLILVGRIVLPGGNHDGFTPMWTLFTNWE